MSAHRESAASDLLSAAVERGWSIACAESLTGGLVAATIVDVPGASRAFRGGIVAYDTAVKQHAIGVDADLLARAGAVHPEVARQLADRVRTALATGAGPAQIGLATTGVAGPDPQDGQPVGTVFVAVATPASITVRELALAGDRFTIRRDAVRAVLELAAELVGRSE